MTVSAAAQTSLTRPTAPIPQALSRRVPALDVLRGIAILGTLASNIWIFTAGVGAAVEGRTPAWLAEVSSWIPNGKFLGLLTIMFGIGLEIQRQSAQRSGRGWPGKYPIRAGLLFLDGPLNSVFVVQFDVLRAYAVTGLIVAFLLLTSERVQTWLIGIFVTGHLALMAFMAAGPATSTAAEAATTAGRWSSTTTRSWARRTGRATAAATERTCSSRPRTWASASASTPSSSRS